MEVLKRQRRRDLEGHSTPGLMGCKEKHLWESQGGSQQQTPNTTLGPLHNMSEASRGTLGVSEGVPKDVIFSVHFWSPQDLAKFYVG